MKNHPILTLLISTVVIVFTFSSCVSRKNMVYLQKPRDVSNIAFNAEKNLKIKPGDLLTIRVSAEEQEAAQPFNLTKSIGSNQSMPGSVELETYMVSRQGTIEFPVVGTMKVEGLTTFELSDKIKGEIVEYVRDVIVNVRILNFKVTVLGEVKSPGTFNIEDDHLTLAQALGMAGDLSIYGKRDNILVMREENGQQVNVYLDLTNSSVVNSPYYNLKQGDVVYVEPKIARVQSASSLGVASRWLSIASVVTSLVILFTK